MSAYEKLYDENVNLRQEIQANEQLTKTLLDEQGKWQDGIKELERIKDGVRIATERFRRATGLEVVALETLLDTLELLCTSKH